jgi:hypothetical protein
MNEITNPLDLLVEVDKRHDEIQTYMREKFEEYRANYQKVWGHDRFDKADRDFDTFTYEDGKIYYSYMTGGGGYSWDENGSIPLEEFTSIEAIEQSKKLWDVQQAELKHQEKLNKKLQEEKRLKAERAEYERLKEKFEKGT